MIRKRQVVCAALLAGVMACATQRADADPPSGGPVRVDGAFQWRVNVNSGCGQFHLGPWYSYFPYEAHFSMVAPQGGGNWLQQRSMYGGQCLPTDAAPTGQAAGDSNQPGRLNLGQQPAPTFGNYGPAPSYWYINR
jgi:hypothetical protein